MPTIRNRRPFFTSRTLLAFPFIHVSPGHHPWYGGLPRHLQLSLGLHGKECFEAAMHHPCEYT